MYDVLHCLHDVIITATYQFADFPERGEFPIHSEWKKTTSLNGSSLDKDSSEEEDKEDKAEEEDDEGEDGEDEVKEEDNEDKEYIHNDELEDDTDDEALEVIANIHDDNLFKDNKEDEDCCTTKSVAKDCLVKHFCLVVKPSWTLLP